MHASAQTTGTCPINPAASSLARHPSESVFSSLNILRDEMKPRILPDRSGPPAERMTPKVYPII